MIGRRHALRDSSVRDCEHGHAPMPIVSRFYGIVIRMFYREHAPAHIHVEHCGQRATFDFEGNALAGEIRSRKARQRVRRWILVHHDELEANWEKMKAGEELEAIEP
jgi:hypothetical protein